MVMHARKPQRISDGYFEKHQAHPYQVILTSNASNNTMRGPMFLANSLAQKLCSQLAQSNVMKYNSKRTASDYVSESRYSPLRSPNGNVSHGHGHSAHSSHTHHHYSHCADDRYVSSRNAYIQKGIEKERDRDYKSSRDESVSTPKEKRKDCERINHERERSNHERSDPEKKIRTNSLNVSVSRSNKYDKRSAASTSLAPGSEWSEHISSSGKKYYYNSISEVSQWEKPRDWDTKKTASKDTTHTSRSNHEKRLSRSVRDSEKSSKRNNSTSERYWNSNTGRDEEVHERTRSKHAGHEEGQSLQDMDISPDRSTPLSETSYPTREPSTSYATREPSTSYASREPSTSYASREPSTSYASREPSTSYASREPSTSYASREPSTSYASREPSTSYASRESSTSYASREPSTSYASREPSTSYATREPSTSTGGRAAAARPGPAQDAVASTSTSGSVSGVPPVVVLDNSNQPSGSLLAAALPRIVAAPTVTMGVAVGGGVSPAGASAGSSTPTRDHGPPTPTHSENVDPHAPPLHLDNHQPRKMEGLGSYSSVVGSVQPAAPMLTPSLVNYVRADLTAHLHAWPADLLEKQANKYTEDAYQLGCMQCTRVSAELKCARSLVRHTEIQATLQEQKIMYLRQQISRLEELKSQNSFMSED